MIKKLNIERFGGRSLSRKKITGVKVCVMFGSYLEVYTFILKLKMLRSNAPKVEPGERILKDALRCI